MPIGELEPLYRYLATCNQRDPVASLLIDMEQLAKGKYIKNMSEGIHQVIDTAAIRAEVRDQIARNIGPPPAGYQTTYQALGKRMYVAINRVVQSNSKTALAYVINEDDTVELLYIDPDPINQFASTKPTIYSSINTVVVLEGGTIKHGFLRCETSMMTYGNDLLIKSDFKLSRTTPFYTKIKNYYSAVTSCSVGPAVKTMWEEAWTQ